MPLRILIVGAGISGLTAAIAFRRGGHQVTIYERSTISREVGQGIAISPNAGRVLRDMGFDFTRARLTQSTGIKFIKGDTLEQLIPDRDNAKDSVEYGIAQMSSYRPDLHEELVRLACDETGAGPAVKIVFSEAVTGVDAEIGQVTFADGKSARADLVVAADGVQSQAASILHYPEPPPSLQVDDWCVHRFTLPYADMLADPQLEQLKPANDYRARIAVSPDYQKWVIWYFCRNTEMCSFGVYTRPSTVHSHEPSNNDHALRFQGGRAALKEILSEFSPPILKLVDMATEVLPVWRATKRSPLQTHHRGCFVAIGDAAHPQNPTLGWGANSAIEDGGFLGTLFENVVSNADHGDSVSKRLAIYTAHRLPRTAVYEAYSNSTLFADAPQEQNDRIAKRICIKCLPRNRVEMYHWFKSYDALQEARDAVLSLK